MRILLAFVIVSLAAPAAFAQGGIELNEQSAKGVGMAGAQVGIADDPSAIFYNPAGIGFQPGLGLQGGGFLVIARTHVSPDDITLWHTQPVPTGYASLRWGKHLAFGVGGFANMGEYFSYPPGWRGRFEGYMVNISTLTIQPTIAIRILSWLSIGAGIDIVPAWAEVFRGINFGGGEGNVHVGLSDTGIGGNVGVLLKIIPKHLNFGVSYRSRIDLDFTGHGAISAPPELRSLTGGLQLARATIVLPHNFSIGFAGFTKHLQVDAEVKVSIWRDLQALAVTLTDPAAPPGTAPTVDTIPLNLHNTWGLRGGAQYGFLSEDRLKLRLGVGYDTTPVPTSTLGPLLPDTDRVLVSVGAGYRWGFVTVDVGYMAVFLLKETSTNPNLIATYQSFGQVVALSVTGTWETFLQHSRVPRYDESE